MDCSNSTNIKLKTSPRNIIEGNREEQKKPSSLASNILVAKIFSPPAQIKDSAKKCEFVGTVFTIDQPLLEQIEALLTKQLPRKAEEIAFKLHDETVRHQNLKRIIDIYLKDNKRHEALLLINKMHDKETLKCSLEAYVSQGEQNPLITSGGDTSAEEAEQGDDLMAFSDIEKESLEQGEDISLSLEKINDLELLEHYLINGKLSKAEKLAFKMSNKQQRHQCLEKIVQFYLKNDQLNEAFILMNKLEDKDIINRFLQAVVIEGELNSRQAEVFDALVGAWHHRSINIQQIEGIIQSDDDRLEQFIDHFLSHFKTFLKEKSFDKAKSLLPLFAKAKHIDPNKEIGDCIVEEFAKNNLSLSTALDLVATIPNAEARLSIMADLYLSQDDIVKASSLIENMRSNSGKNQLRKKIVAFQDIYWGVK